MCPILDHGVNHVDVAPRYGRPAPLALVEAAMERRRPRDVAIFLILRYTGMRRESVATLRVHHLDGTWGCAVSA